MIEDRAPAPPRPDLASGIGASPAPRERFDWLAADSRNLRSGLRDIEAAIRRGWRPESEADRQALVGKLSTLMADGRANARAQLRAGRCLLAMGASDMGLARPSPWKG
jgi:hypothetical protein